MDKSIERKVEGRYGNMVRLSAPIFKAQDEELTRLSVVLDKSKSDIVREALTIYFGIMKKEGV